MARSTWQHDQQLVSQTCRGREAGSKTWTCDIRLQSAHDVLASVDALTTNDKEGEEHYDDILQFRLWPESNIRLWGRKSGMFFNSPPKLPGPCLMFHDREGQFCLPVLIPHKVMSTQQEEASIPGVYLRLVCFLR